MFLGPEGGHYRRSGYARRVFRPASDGRYEAIPSSPAGLIIADATAWPGVPVAVWPAAPTAAAPGVRREAHAVGYTPPRGRGIRVIPGDTPLVSWLPVRRGLTPHGLRHGHKTWMAEDGIPEILAEQRLGHEVPGMRGLYAHASDRMRADLKAALQARWEDSLHARAAIHPYSPVPLLDALLANFREQNRASAHLAAARITVQQPPAPGGMGERGMGECQEAWEKMISQIPPKRQKASPQGLE